MFNIYDAYVNALTEAKSVNKFDDMTEIDINTISVEDVPLLYDCGYDIPLKDLVLCTHCGTVFDIGDIETEEVTVDSFEDYWDYNRETPEQRDATYTEDREVCPVCGYGSDPDDDEFEYREVTISDLFDYVDAFDDYLTKDVREAIIDLLDKEKEMKTEGVKLEEDDADFTNLKDKTKTEMLKYLKKSGLDVDNLIKTGVSLSSMQDAIDKLLSDYTSPVIAEYEKQFNVGLAWDYEIADNDIIITIENM